MSTRANVAPTRALVIRLSVALALTAASAYALIARGVLGLGGLRTDEASPVIVSVAAGCYRTGGLMVLLGRRVPWPAGVAINALLETGLIYFLFTTRRRPAREPG